MTGKPPALRIAVCTNRAFDAVQPCLGQLARCRLGRSTTVVTSGMAPDRAAEFEDRLPKILPGAELRHQPARGLSRARNEALAACGPDDIVAYIDDDAVAAADWHERLLAAWASAEPDVGCIGGPVRPTFLGTRPVWLGDALLPVLSVLDFGEQPLRLDGRGRALYGANISFRCTALRAIGGFDVRLGAGAPLEWGEDDDAQRRLFDAGWSIEYHPGPVVSHLIPDARLTIAAFLRRQLRKGVAYRRLGLRTRRLAARRCLAAVARLPLAVLRKDHEEAMARAMTLAENLGVLVSPVMPPRASAVHGGRATGLARR